MRLILQKYQNHPSILAIIQNPENNFNSFSFLEAEVCQVWQQIRSLKDRELTGEDQIPSKLVLLAADEPATPLTYAIDSSIRNYRFPDNGNQAEVCPLD